MNAHVRDNTRYLKGLDGAVTLSDGLNLGANELTINSLETVGVDGIVNKEQVEDHTHQDADNCGTLDHGLALTGLTDDDHTQYTKKATLTTQGDLYYASGASTPARLAIGAAGKYLYSDGTDPSWVVGTIPQYGIIIWSGTIANIPAGFVICDGNNSSPNLLTRFLEGVATAATDPGATGGATAKNTAGHIHSLVAGGVLSDDTDSLYRLTHASATDSIADIRPLYYDVAFIMKS